MMKMKSRKEHNQFSRHTELTEEGKQPSHELQRSMLSHRGRGTRTAEHRGVHSRWEVCRTEVRLVPSFKNVLLVVCVS